MNQLTTWKKPFFALYFGQSFSLLSSSAVQFSIIWWITIETGSALALTIASVAGLLPQAIIGLFAGVWIDRFNRKKIIILADGIVAASSLLLGILFFLGIRSLTLVYVVLFVRALGETFHKPALQALIPQIVPQDELTKAGGFGQMINTACTMLGPMLGALLMSITNLQWIMLLDVLGAFLAIVTLTTIKTPQLNSNRTGKIYVFQDMKQGILAIKSNKALLRLSIPMLISTIVFVPLGILLPLMVRNYFFGSAWHNGLIQTLFSLGMLIAAMLISVFGGFKKHFLMISLFTSLLGLTSIIAGLIPANLLWLFCILVFLMGSTGSGFNIPFTAYIQNSIPPQNLGKVLSLITSVMSFAAPIGMFIAGPIAETMGVNNWMVISGILMIVVGIISYVSTKEFDIKLDREDMIYED
ncbi:MFS transporter [Alkalicella caledoniensis]|uniref:MFS transporter n=1 Tax=Alkalicella caledoniensis TaxID=2731377 RepID=A0A7G9W9I2_ALKCA|nr:MFS transporter [Alkalicella caledoniensis]QNO15344.1 MFS transporter [Alkalicella caledoniensis]